MENLDTVRTHRLGGRAFLLFLGAGIIWILLFTALLGAYWWYAAPYVPKDYVIYYDYTVKLFALFLGGFIAYQFSSAYLRYRSHGYRFDDEFFHITKGYLDRHEIGIVYHQIQTVTVERNVSARLFGVAKLTIVTNATNGSHENHLPGIDMRKARLVQRELLSRSKRGQQAPREPRYEPVPFVEDEYEDEE